MGREMMKEHMQPHLPAFIDYQSLVFLAAGGSGIVYAVDEERVFKEFHGDGIDVERRVFERLGPHKNIVRHFHVTDNGLVLERGRSLRTMIRESQTDQISLDLRLRWLQEAAEGIRYMHDHNIIHADVGCNNWIIIQGHLKIIDFEGCSIDGEEAGSCYEWFSYKESSPAISQKTDIFAFGCAIYEVISGGLPYEELSHSDDRMLRVKELYAENQFPEVEDMPLGDLMTGCWYGTFDTMDEVLQKLKTTGSPVTMKAYSNANSKGLVAEFLDVLRSWSII